MAGLGELTSLVLDCGLRIADWGPRPAPPGGWFSTAKDFQAQDFAGLAFGGDLEGTAADFAVGGEALGGNAGVNH
jgi:hypothetical protein